jgi:hypothetical protein
MRAWLVALTGFGDTAVLMPLAAAMHPANTTVMLWSNDYGESDGVFPMPG